MIPAKEMLDAGAPEGESMSVWWFVAGAVVLGGWGLVRFANQPLSEETRDRIAIEECWKTQERKDLDPGTARFAAGACYSMEADYKSKYGHNP